MTTEQPLIKEILIAASREGARLFRNNLGSLEDKNGRWVQYGVCNPGGSDLIGWTKTGRFLAVEVKAGRTATTQAQANFVSVVNAGGGIAVIARSVDDVITALKQETRRP